MTVTTEEDIRAPLVRLRRLLDPASADLLHSDDDGCGVVTIRGTVDGAPVVAYCTDARKMGGSLGAAGADRIVEAIDAAVLEGCPVIGLWHSGGARLADGVESMEGMGRMFSAITMASGQVPQISVILGPAAGAAAYGPALTDVVIMTEASRVFVTGPDIVRSVTGERIDMAGLGGPDSHGRRSGVAHVTVADEPDACACARRLAGFFTRRIVVSRAVPGPAPDPGSVLPDSPRRAYDVHKVVFSILDGEPDRPDFQELQAKWVPNMVIGLGRLGGRSVGVIANNPIRKGGCLDSLSAEKAARFVRLCDAHGIPLIVLVDVPGYLPGVDQEWGGVVRRGAKLLHAFAASMVPRVTLITRKAYGGAYIAMNSRSLGATTVLAWPDAEVAVMGAEAAVDILHWKTLAAAPPDERPRLKARLAEDHRRDAGGIARASFLGAVDEVIPPQATHARLIEVLARDLARVPHLRGRHANIPL